MNTRNLPASVLLLAIGAGAVLLIGAFTRFDSASSAHPAASLPSPPPLTQDDHPAEAAAEPTLPADLSPGLAELIKLAQAHVDESVILAYIKNSGQVFSPTADEILYLSDLGLSQEVIGVLVKNAPPDSAAQTAQAAPAAPVTVPMGQPAPPIPPQQDATVGAFFNDMASYGTWAQQPDYGLCWQPTVETIDADWRPYVDAGQWLYSDSGWYWQSDYTWGWAAFHYGRWANVPKLGWVWVPGNIWAPAWVAWRSTSAYIGWAPLPPGVGLNVLAELTYLGRPAGPNPTFGLPPSAYTFVNTGELTSRHLPSRVAPISQVRTLVHNSVVIDSYALVNNRIFNGGASREAVAAAAHKTVPVVALRSVTSPEAAGLAMNRKTLAVYCPAVPAAGASPAAPRANSSSPVPKTAERSPSQESIVLAENDSADASVMPVEPEAAGESIQLPPLRYAAPASTTVVHRHRRNNAVASAPDSSPANVSWPREFGAATVQQPATPAPRLDGFNPPGRQVESPRPATLENRPAQVEYHAPPVEPARAAPAASVTSASPSRSGR